MSGLDAPSLSLFKAIMKWFPMIFASVAVGLILYGSLVPGRLRPRSGLDGHVEHGLAYALCMTLVLPFAGNPWAIAVLSIAMIAAAAILETAQHWIPGRSGRLTHFLASAVGVVVPALATILLAMR